MKKYEDVLEEIRTAFAAIRTNPTKDFDLRTECSAPVPEVELMEEAESLIQAAATFHKRPRENGRQKAITVTMSKRPFEEESQELIKQALRAISGAGNGATKLKGKTNVNDAHTK